MSAISLKSITGITSITTPAGVDNQLTLHTNNTTERVKIDVAGNVHVNNHLAVSGVTTTNSLHVAANNTTVGVAITQSGTGDILKLYDGTAEVFTVANQDDGIGAVTISSPKPRIVFNETNASPDYQIRMNGGIFSIHDSTNDIGRISITSSRTDINNPVLLNNDTVWIGDKLVHWTDDDTAIRFPAANTISMETAGSERLRISSDGNMGLGTNSLVGNSANVYLTVNGSNLGGIALKANGTTQGYLQGTSSLIRLSSDGSKPITFDTNGSERLRIDSSGRFMINMDTSVTGGRFQVNNTFNTFFTASNDAQGCVLQLQKTRATSPGTYTIVQDGDTLGKIEFKGANGSAAVIGAAIQAKVNGTPGSGNDLPTDLTFRVMPDGTGSTLERLRITSDGKIGINDAAPERTMDVRGSNCMIQLEGTAGNGKQYSLCSTDDATGAGVDGGPSGSFAIFDDSTGQARLRIDPNGNTTFLVTGGTLLSSATGSYGISIHNHNSPSMGHLFIYGDNGLIRFRNTSNTYTAQMGYTESSNTLFFANQEGGTTMYINADGVQLYDNNKFLCGNDKDLEIFHNNSNAYIKNGTGYTMYRAGQHVFENSNGATEMFRIKSDGRIGINANPSVNHEYLHIKPVGNNVLDIRYELNSSTDIRHKFFDDTGTQRGTFGFTNYANNSAYPNFHDSFYLQTDPGSNGTLATALRITREGQFIKPLTYQFFLETSGTSVSGGWTQLTGMTLDSTHCTGVSNGTYWNNSNQRFTAPVTGTYQFFIGGFSPTAEGGGTNHRYMYLFRINGGHYKYGFGGNYSDGNTPMEGGTLNYKLSVNDYVEVWYYSAISATWGNSSHRFFWGGYFLG